MAQTSGGQHAHKLSVAGLIVTLGIIYGDIGTSPLYVFKSIINHKIISEQLVYGAISCVFWTLTLQTTFKYVFLTLRADNRGEGGIFSLFALIRRYVKWIYIPAIIGAAMLLADGMITPPISVSSAVEGLGGVKGLENIIVPGNNLTVGIVMTIISLLFFFQRFGTKIVGFAFGPIMLLWFSMILLLGLSQIMGHIAILKSLNPYYAYDLLVNYPQGFWLLGAVFLCTTGAEALYSDLGHCGRKNIQVSWMFVKTALVFNYMGQGAWLIQHIGQPMEGLNPFYEIMPHWFLLIGIGVATVAAIIASQALISGSFTLINEAISLNFWPRVTVKFPTDQKGQIYIPSLNLILWVGCITMLLYFRKSELMEAAYGFSIIITMIMTTILMNFYMLNVKRWSQTLVAVIIAIFVVVEFSFFIANTVKIKEAAITFAFSLSMIFVMMIWHRARKIANRYLDFVKIKDYLTPLVDLSADKEVPRYATHLVYLTKANNHREIEHRIIDSILNRKPKRADIYWFIHIDRTDSPYGMEYSIRELVDDKVMRVDFRLGFRIQPRVNVLFKKVMQELNECQELGIYSRYESLKSKDFHTDITYVIIESFFSIENELTVREDFIMDVYFNIKQLSQSDQKAFGLDNDMTIVEHVPLIIKANENLPLKRIFE
ncbi:MAG: potassium transporter Kup [Chitinophagia bacterium]|jgi:KUP system potassium uptake protein|nr:potassium transporter Kup [Chitinophagia bacterium]